VNTLKDYLHILRKPILSRHILTKRLRRESRRLDIGDNAKGAEIWVFVNTFDEVTNMS
jgi:hypothetical protein